METLFYVAAPTHRPDNIIMILLHKQEIYTLLYILNAIHGLFSTKVVETIPNRVTMK